MDPGQGGAYPHQGYYDNKQPGYPQQPGYPPQPGYQPAYPGHMQGPALTTEAPPPYYPGQQSMQSATNNTVVVTSQPVPQQVHTVYSSGGNPEFALPAIIFGVAVTVCYLSLGCWYAILCSGIGIALAAAASSSASAGDMETARQYNTGSLVCTVVSLVSAVLPFFALIIWIIVITTSY